jgi:hypothetical protein
VIEPRVPDLRLHSLGNYSLSSTSDDWFPQETASRIFDLGAAAKRARKRARP